MALKSSSPPLTSAVAATTAHGEALGTILYSSFSPLSLCFPFSPYYYNISIHSSILIDPAFSFPPVPAPLSPSARLPPPLLPPTSPSASSTSQPAAAITSDDVKAQVKAMKKKVDKLLSRITTRLNVMLVRVEAMIEALEGEGDIMRSKLEELDAIITEMSLLKLDLHSIINELEFIDNELNHCLFLCDFLG